METIIAIATVVLIGAAIPGPSFLLVARTTLGESRGAGLAAAVGMGTGSVLLAALALGGLHVLLSKVPALYLVLKIAGGIYLLYLAIRLWRHSGDYQSMAATNKNPSATVKRSAFLTALFVQLSNPKAAVVYGSLFATFIPVVLTWQLALAILVCVFTIETLWYVVVALLLSTPASRKAYLHSSVLVNRVAGAIMGALGLKLVFTQ